MSEAAGQLRAIKLSLVNTFPSYNQSLDIGPALINTFEGRIAALEAMVSVDELKFASGKIDINTTDPAYQVTGLGFTPSLVLFSTWVLGDVQANPVAGVSFGFVDAGDEFSVGMSTDALFPNTGRHFGFSSAAAAVFMVAGANEGRLQFSAAIDADGFTITRIGVVQQEPNRVTWTAFS